MRQERRLNWSLLFVCLTGCVVLGGVGVSVVAADGAYDLDVSPAVETPSETVSFQGETYEIDAFAVIEPGDSLGIDVTAPDGTDFDVYLYNSDGGIEEFGPSGTGSEMDELDTSDDIAPGTYSLVLSADSNFQAVHPVVVSGYDIGFSAPDDPESGETMEIDDISVTPTELSGDPNGVEVVVWNDDRGEQIEATGSDGSYSASVDLDEFEPGEYNVHVAALGEEEFRGQPEILGLSEQQTITVAESEPENGDESGGPAPAPGSESGTDEPANNEEPIDDNGSNSDADEGNGTDATPTEPTETVELVDEAPDEPGVQVSFGNATARAVTLSNESASGNVTVTERSEPPANSSPPAGSPIATVEITVPESERDAPATIELVVDADAVEDTERLAVEKYHAENDTWTRLKSTVTETSATTVTLTAETPGFSVFAVTETSDSTDSTTGENGSDSSTSNGTDGSTSESSGGSIITPSESTDESAEDDRPEDQPGFGFVAAALAVLLGATGRSIRRRSKRE